MKEIIVKSIDLSVFERGGANFLCLWKGASWHRYWGANKLGYEDVLFGPLPAEMMQSILEDGRFDVVATLDGEGRSGEIILGEVVNGVGRFTIQDGWKLPG